jgi:hypothetical protein
MLGGTPPEWQCLEVLAMEWLSERGGWTPEEWPVPPKPEMPQTLPGGKDVIGAVAEAAAVVMAEAPPTECPKALDARVVRLVAARQRFDLTLGALALRILKDRVWAEVGCHSFAEYCTERLGMEERAVRERVWFERRMSDLPGLREAVTRGHLTYSKALLVAREAAPSSVKGLILRAAATTWQQADRESLARERERNRACGIRRIWGRR